jgi:hypothetical protein
MLCEDAQSEFDRMIALGLARGVPASINASQPTPQLCGERRHDDGDDDDDHRGHGHGEGDD